MFSSAVAKLRRSAFMGVACAALAVGPTPAAPESPSLWSIACKLDVSMSIKDQVASAVRQRLRALGDVTVGGADSGCQIGIVGLTFEESSAAGTLKVHFLSVLVTYHLDYAAFLSDQRIWRSFGMTGPAPEGLTRFLSQTNPEAVKMHAIYSGTDLAEMSDRIAAAIDNEVFEPSRQAYQALRAGAATSQ
jgi:hypothetical protein